MLVRYARPKKSCLFGVTSPKKIGSVGWLLFLFFNLFFCPAWMYNGICQPIFYVTRLCLMSFSLKLLYIYITCILNHCLRLIDGDRRVLQRRYASNSKFQARKPIKTSQSALFERVGRVTSNKQLFFRPNISIIGIVLLHWMAHFFFSGALVIRIPEGRGPDGTGIVH